MTTMSVPPSAIELADDFQELMARYVDLLTAQHDALTTGLVTKAAFLGRSAESVLNEAYRVDRRLGALRSTSQLEPTTKQVVERKLRASMALVRDTTNRLSGLLGTARSKMLSEIGDLEPNRALQGSNGEWTAQPMLLNIKT